MSTDLPGSNVKILEGDSIENIDDLKKQIQLEKKSLLNINTTNTNTIEDGWFATMCSMHWFDVIISIYNVILFLFAVLQMTTTYRFSFITWFAMLTIAAVSIPFYLLYVTYHRDKYHYFVAYLVVLGTYMICYWIGFSLLLWLYKYFDFNTTKLETNWFLTDGSYNFATQNMTMIFQLIICTLFFVDIGVIFAALGVCITTKDQQLKNKII